MMENHQRKQREKEMSDKREAYERFVGKIIEQQKKTSGRIDVDAAREMARNVAKRHDHKHGK
jgi:hypothetical protein